jgi:hypothetical protein
LPAIYDTAGNPSAQDPPTSAAVVTPSDTVDLPSVSTAFYIGGAGNLTVMMVEGMTVTFTAIPVGTQLRIRASRVMATGTTATLIIAMWR